jgi:metal-sulfur cluster biosynthetic enzyme
MKGDDPVEEQVMTREQIRSALRRVMDPEMGVNIVDLGLVYEVEIEGTHGVRVAMTLTSPACPLGAYLEEEVGQAIRQDFPEASPVQVDLVWKPRWQPSMMSLDAKRQLGWSQ